METAEVTPKMAHQRWEKEWHPKGALVASLWDALTGSAGEKGPLFPLFPKVCSFMNFRRFDVAKSIVSNSIPARSEVVKKQI